MKLPSLETTADRILLLQVSLKFRLLFSRSLMNLCIYTAYFINQLVRDPELLPSCNSLETKEGISVRQI